MTGMVRVPRLFRVSKPSPRSPAGREQHAHQKVAAGTCPQARAASHWGPITAFELPRPARRTEGRSVTRSVSLSLGKRQTSHASVLIDSVGLL